MHSIAPSCLDLLLFQLNGESINDNNHVSSRSSVRCFDHRSAKQLPVPEEPYEAWVGPDKVNLTQQCCQIFLSWTLNSKATLGTGYTKAKGGTRGEVSLAQPWSQMLTLIKIKRKVEGRGNGGK